LSDPVPSFQLRADGEVSFEAHEGDDSQFEVALDDEPEVETVLDAELPSSEFSLNERLLEAVGEFAVEFDEKQEEEEEEDVEEGVLEVEEEVGGLVAQVEEVGVEGGLLGGEGAAEELGEEEVGVEELEVGGLDEGGEERARVGGRGEAEEQGVREHLDGVDHAPGDGERLLEEQAEADVEAQHQVRELHVGLQALLLLRHPLPARHLPHRHLPAPQLQLPVSKRLLHELGPHSRRNAPQQQRLDLPEVHAHQPERVCHVHRQRPQSLALDLHPQELLQVLYSYFLELHSSLEQH